MRRFALLVLAACQQHQPAPPAAPAPPPAPHPPMLTRYDEKIAQLASIDEAGIGFSPTLTGMQFLPVATSDEQGVLLLGQPAPVRSAVLTEIVAGGAAAIPALLRCLDNATPTRLPPMAAMMWSARADEYDINRRTTKLPAGVDLDAGPEVPKGYTVKVGDLCFVALGQIVNRTFAAVRYQPTGGLVISSPVDSPALRKAIRDEWGATTKLALRASLIRDFETPDHVHRRLGALLRLRYYEPDAVEPLVAAELARPTYDSDSIRTVVRGLYGRAPADRARDFAAYVAAHGAAARDGIEQVLFEDLDAQEAYEQKRVSPPTTGASYRARECLVELFGRAATVTSKDRPYPTYSSQYERAQLVSSLRPSR